jgi:ketosteroid isomerase-like protein
MTRWILCAALLLLPSFAPAQTNAELKEQVRRTEIAFAKSLADRSITAFASFLSKETIFMSNGNVTHGASQVVERWEKFFDGAQAPFSWEPETVEVLDSGKLAMTSGPVRDPSGKRIGTFNSVWRRESNSQWKIVLDNGCPACNCEAAGK